MSKLKKFLFSFMAIGLLATSASYCSAARIVLSSGQRAPYRKLRIGHSRRQTEAERRFWKSIAQDTAYQREKNEFVSTLSNLLGKSNLVRTDFMTVGNYISVKYNVFFPRECYRTREGCVYFLHKYKDLPSFYDSVRECVNFCQNLNQRGIEKTTKAHIGKSVNSIQLPEGQEDYFLKNPNLTILDNSVDDIEDDSENLVIDAGEEQVVQEPATIVVPTKNDNVEQDIPDPVIINVPINETQSRLIFPRVVVIPTNDAKPKLPSIIEIPTMQEDPF